MFGTKALKQAICLSMKRCIKNLNAFCDNKIILLLKAIIKIIYDTDCHKMSLFNSITMNKQY